MGKEQREKEMRIEINSDRIIGGRDGYVDFLKFAMSIVMILYHMNFFLYGLNNVFLFPAGYRAVEVFFVISGYYLFQSLEKNNNCSFQHFLVHRIKSIYPQYLTCYLVTFLFFITMDSLPVISKAGTLRYSYIIIDLLMMQNWGFSLPTIGDWFTSALLLGGIIIFWIYRVVPVKYHCTFLALLALTFSAAIFVTHYNLQVHEARYHISSGVVRATIGLSVGCVAFIIKKHNHLVLGTKVFALCSSFILLLMFLYTKTPLDFLVLPVAGVLIMSGNGLRISSIQINNMFSYLGSLSYWVYLIHSVIRSFLLKIDIALGYNISLNIVLSIVVAAMLYCSAQAVRNCLRKRVA